MTPILGIMASAISGNLWAPGKDFDSIATVTVGSGGSSTISFTSIPSTYRHLQIRLTGVTNANANTQMRFNSDTGANYSYHRLSGSGSAASAGGSASLNAFYVAGSNLSGFTITPYAAIIDVLDYANTTTNKTMRSLTGSELNTTNGEMKFLSGAWFNTSALSTISLFLDSGTFSQYTSAALYGIK